jgi:type IV secretory pathway VirB3-like protein
MDMAEIPRATSTQAPLMAGVPIKVFAIMFLVIMVVFLTWYMFARRGE